MFDLKITSMKDMFMYADDHNKIMSLVDPKTDVPIMKPEPDHCIIKFDDINTEMVQDVDGITIHGYTLPQRIHVEKILEFVHDFKEAYLFVLDFLALNLLLCQ